jgi:membrane protease YdiL (CAAX protease family)
MKATTSIKSKTKLFIEIIIVLGVMSGTKAIADYFHIIASGSIGIWVGIITATLFLKRRKITWYEIGLYLPKGRKQWLNQIGLGVLAIGSIILIVILTIYVLQPLFGLESDPAGKEKFDFFIGKPNVFILYIVIGVWFGAALGEELLIRGFLLNQLKNLIGENKISWAMALIIQAIIFGFMHSYQGTIGMVLTGLIGLSFGVFYLVSKRKLFPIILAHAVFNTFTMVAFYLSESVT